MKVKALISQVIEIEIEATQHFINIDDNNIDLKTKSKNDIILEKLTK